MGNKSYHNPEGAFTNGATCYCIICGLSWDVHYVGHIFEGEGERCTRCFLKAGKHKPRAAIKRHNKTRNTAYRAKHTSSERKAIELRYIGIDGEGQGRRDHKYNMLAASDESGRRNWIVNAPKDGRLTSKQCLDLILTLPHTNTRIFSFSFNYDITMIVRDLPDKSIWRLMRPEKRKRLGTNADILGPHPVRWEGYELNLQGTKFTVKRGEKRIVIWDLFKFFQAKFVNALKDWKVGSKELLDRMTLMKNKRSEFDKESGEAVKAYCLEECMCIAQLARKLIDAHTAAKLQGEDKGLKLKSYYGAGSTGAAMLTKLGIKEKLKPGSPLMKQAVASGFFGGRFENSLIGEVEGVIYNRDLSSAYPYHITFLPCQEHGIWLHTKVREDLDFARTAIISYTLGDISTSTNPNFKTWGPFPFRASDGSISFPIMSGGGWVWKEEYLAGERHFPHVQFREAWVYICECDCQPFEKIPQYYTERVRIGKEGPGIVLKLGMNSCYGKLAQSVGNALFNSWIWAGMITAGCRAQVLDFLGQHKDWSNMLAVATDGVYTREIIDAAKPIDTGTSATGKPLGGWESKTYDKGMFFARPGIYFPMNPTPDDIKDIRGRGVGKGVVLENWKLIIDTWEKHGILGIARVANVSRFCGAKTSISRNSNFHYRRAAHPDGKLPSYGQWITRRVQMSFDPKPKRERMNDDGHTLKLRSFSSDLRSIPYDRALISHETAALKNAVQEAIEQPDADLEDYEGEDA